MIDFAAGSSNELRIVPCCKRIWRHGETGWCHLPDEHDGAHEGALSIPPARPGFGPRSKRT